MPPIYHFTDGGNLRSIFAAGALRAHRHVPDATDIADPSIRQRRGKIRVPCGSGGVVSEYVPFYFAPRSPMLFSIKSGNVPDVSPDQRRLVYFVSSTEAAINEGHPYVFTNGNASAAYTAFFDDVARLPEVDWDLIGDRYWSNTPDDNDRRRRRGAEFLVHDSLPLALVTEIGVHDDMVAGRVRELLAGGARDLPVTIRSDWYF